MFERFRPKWLNRDIGLLVVQRGLRSLTQAYLIIILPIYLTRIGFSAVELGVLFKAWSPHSSPFSVDEGEAGLTCTNSPSRTWKI